MGLEMGHLLGDSIKNGKIDGTSWVEVKKKEFPCAYPNMTSTVGLVDFGVPGYTDLYLNGLLSFLWYPLLSQT